MLKCSSKPDTFMTHLISTYTYIEESIKLHIPIVGVGDGIDDGDGVGVESIGRIKISKLLFWCIELV